MLDISTISAISAVVAAVGVTIGVVFTILELRNLVETRQTDLTTRLYLDTCNKEFGEALGKFLTTKYKDYNDFVKKYGLVLSDGTVPVAFNVIARRMEATGYLLHRKLVDIDLVLDLFAVGILWEKFKPLAEGLREQLNEPRAYGWFEYLYNEMQKREQRLQQTQQ